MKLKLYQVDAFTDGPFTGNPAAVCPLDKWLPDEVMQSIAMENNLAETAFTVLESAGYRIRWFTPTTEVRLCGHATLATGFTFFNELGFNGNKLDLNCKSGQISVEKNDDRLTLNFPIDEISQVVCPPHLTKSLGAAPKICFKGKDDYFLIYENESIVRSLTPDFNMMHDVDSRGCIVSAKGKDYDVVCRGFFPQSGINEDPATGSAQTTLAVYWPNVLGKSSFSSCQLSQRKGFFNNTVEGHRVYISGKCRLYMRGEIYV